MNNILILCDIFPPAFGPRMGYLCKYLKRCGWNPVVVTEFIDDSAFRFLAGDTDVTYIKYYRRTGFARRAEWATLMIADLLFGRKDSIMCREALKATKKYDFKLILCSAYRTFPLTAARRLARMTRLPLAVDLRDVVEQSSVEAFISHGILRLPVIGKLTVKYFMYRNLKERNRALACAGAVTTVSPWHVEILKQFNPNVHLVYNGYDPEVFFPVETETDTFCITYTGRVISTGIRNPGLLFDAVERLASEGVITPERFRIRWFTDAKSAEVIAREIKRYAAVADFTDFCGYVAADEVPRVLNGSNILLLLTNKTEKDTPKGVMTTKFFEYLAVGKPLLCVRSDGGCLEEAINRTRSGLSASSEQEVYDFVRDHYGRWAEKRPAAVNADRDEIEKFSRERQAHLFIDIFKHLTDACNE